tara:strand:+ start:1908 stop:4166 length:2259 start_codon:yes stop_codon:yes gene_type:complete
LNLYFSITVQAQSSTQVLELAKEAFKNKEYERSILKSKEILTKKSLDDNEGIEVKASLLLARNYTALHKNFYAFEHYLLALYYIDFSPNAYSKRETLIEVADFFRKWEVHPKAISYYRLAIKETTNKNQLSSLYYDLATSFFSNNQLDSSLIYFQKILENKALSTYKRNKTNIKLTNIYITKDQQQRALDWILSFYDEVTDTKQKIGLNNYLGYLYKQKGAYQEALISFRKTCALADAIADKKEKALTLERIGLVWDSQKSYDKALDIFFNSLAIQKKNNLYEDLPNTYNYISKIYLSKGNLNKSITYADAAKNTPSPPPNALINSYKLLTTIYELKGNRKKVSHFERLGDNLNYLLEKAKKENKYKRDELFTKVDDFEEQYINIIQVGHMQGLEYDNLKLTSLAQQNRIDLITKDQAINKQKLLLTKEHLTLEQKAREIEHLQAEGEIQALLIEKQELQKADKQQHITFLEKEKYLNELDLQYKDQKIQNQKQTQQLTILAFIVIIFFLIIIYFLIKQRQNKHKIAFEKEKKETESKLFRSQMNPHFLFNSLNSIKSFIITNEKKEASSYLSKFSLLMRHILDNSDHAYIPLEKEIETLSLYMTLEKLRFDDRFNFMIEVDEELEPENTYLPPMLLQPHIENAILHGLNKKKKGGTVSIVIKEIDNMLLCSVEDNGIGRVQSQALKSKGLQHKSKALKLVQNHLNNINITHKIAITMNIIDLKNDEGIACGTRVEIVLPLKMDNTVISITD